MCPWTHAFWRSPEAGRKPMFVFAFDRALFKFRANTPALEPLFQLPPRIGRRSCTTLNPSAQRLEPAADHPTHLVNVAGPDLIFFEVQVAECKCSPHL